MQTASATDQQFEFVQQLARDLSNGEVRLPSLPAVIVKIRRMLEDEDVDFARLSDVVNTDAALVTRLFVFANSSRHNSSGEEVTSLTDAISRLGLELVRNTALTLAVRQLMVSEKHGAVLDEVKRVWVRSMRIASLAHAVASYAPGIREESAFMCGLLHEIGKLYILSKAGAYPGFLGDRASLHHVLEDWHSQVGRSIVEQWGFPEDVVQSLDPMEFLDEHGRRAPKLVDSVYVAMTLLDTDPAYWPSLLAQPAVRKFGITEQDLPELDRRYREKLDAMRQSLA